MLLIPGTGSVAHLRENLTAERATLDDEALRNLDSIGAGTGSSSDCSPMTSAALRNPGADLFITPQNSPLLLIHYQRIRRT